MFETIVDFLAATTIILLALSIAIPALTTLSLPPPKPRTPTNTPTTIQIRGGKIVSDRLVRIWVVAFNSDGSYSITEATAPANLPPGTFIVVFTGKTATYTGSPPSLLTGYVSRAGVTTSEPAPPYILVEEGRVVRVVQG